MKRLFVILPLLRLVALTAFLLSAFLAFEGLSGRALPGCGAGSGCDAVAASRWSRIGPVPVALLGALVYLGIFIASLMTSGYESPQKRPGVWTTLMLLALLAVGAAVWFTALQVVWLRQFCFYCAIDHMLGLIAAGLIFHAVSQSRSENLRPLPVARAVAAGAAAVLVFVIVQIAWLPRPTIVSADTLLAATAPASQPATLASVTTVTAPATKTLTIDRGRRVIALRGLVEAYLNEWPVLGPTDAQFVIFDLFDYTCPHCRQLHDMLGKARYRYGTQIAFVPVPVPLNSDCNLAIQQTNPAHADACILASYAFAVWKADPKKFNEYHYWLFEPQKPPSRFDARAKAEALVTINEFETALNDPVVAQKLRSGVEMYLNVGRGSIPKLILPEAVASWPISNERSLYDVLESHLSVKAETK